MKFYRGVRAVNIALACIVLFEVIGYSWIFKHKPNVNPVVDVMIVILCILDLIWSIRLSQK